MTEIAFTGNRGGMTPAQRQTLEKLIEGYGLGHSIFHHGCAAGSDFQAAMIAREWGLWVVGHPGKNAYDEVVSNLTSADNETCDPESYIDRNRIMVRKGDLVIAAPRQTFEERRSGTWATIRYARTLERHIYIIWPDGTIKEENA